MRQTKTQQPKRWHPLLISLGLCFLLAACSDSEAIPDLPLRPGLSTTLKAGGELFSQHVIAVEDNIVQWEFRWQNRKIATSKLYMNLIYLFNREGNEVFVNEFNLNDLAALYPLEVGKEISFSGIRRSSDFEDQQPIYGHVLVRNTDTITVKDQTYPVFVIDVSTNFGSGDNQTDTLITHWHSPELGLNLKTKLVSGEQTFWVNVVDIISPEENARKNVGTVRVSAPIAAMPQPHTNNRVTALR